MKCIDHVQKSYGYSDDHYEIIIVDNHSSDDSVPSIRNKFPKVKIIENYTNLGFGAGNNVGVNKAKGDLLLLLNSDAFVEINTISTLIEIIQDNTLVAVGPQLRNEDGHIQPSGGYFPKPIRLLLWLFWIDRVPLLCNVIKPYRIYNPNRLNHNLFPDWLSGACILLRKKDYLDIEGFDENIFLYGEEVEFFYRLKNKTRKNALYTVQTHIIHLQSASIKKSDVAKYKEEIKGVEYFCNKHSHSSKKILKWIIRIGIWMRMNIYRFFPEKKQIFNEYRSYLQNG